MGLGNPGEGFLTGEKGLFGEVELFLELELFLSLGEILFLSLGLLLYGEFGPTSFTCSFSFETLSFSLSFEDFVCVSCKLSCVPDRVGDRAAGERLVSIGDGRDLEDLVEELLDEDLPSSSCFFL